MYQLLYDLCGIPAETAEGYSAFVANATVVLVLVFVVFMIDFLAKILTRFVPRWNRNS